METRRNDKSELSEHEFAEAVPFEFGRSESIEETKPGWFLIWVTFSVALGGLLFGYDTGVISGVLVVIGDSLGHELSSGEKELITSITSAGAFVGGIFGGLTIDRFGRKWPIIVASILFTVGAIIQAAAFSVAQMTVGRLFVGFGVGIAAMVVPVFIAELSPSKYRGQMITLDSICITGSQVLSYVIDFAFQHVRGGWRYMVGAAAIPSVLLGIAIFFVPETPRYLIQKNRIDEAITVIQRIYPNASEEQVETKARLIRLSFQIEQESSQQRGFKDRLKMLYVDKANLRALLVACGLMGIQQFAGSNTMTYYAPTLFSLVGFTQSIAVSIVTSGANFIFTVVSLVIIDKVGRRKLLAHSMWLMSFWLLVAAIAIHYIPIEPDLTLDNKAELTWAGILLLVAIILYIAAYAVGLGNVAWFGNELFPMEVRSIGTSMVTCTCWGSNVVVSSTFLSMIKGLTPSGAFGFYVGTTFIGWLCVLLFYPDVTDMTLEEIKEVFHHGFGVKYSNKLRKARKTTGTVTAKLQQN